MKKKRYHVIKYISSGHYFVDVGDMQNYYAWKQNSSSDPRVKLIAVFDNMDEAVRFRNAIDLL